MLYYPDIVTDTSIGLFQHNFDGPYMTFEPVTFVPYERNLIVPELMTQEQVRRCFFLSKSWEMH